MASFKFGDDKIKVIFVVGSKTLHPGVIRKGVDFNISSNLNLDQKCFEALDVNYKIGTLKQTYFKKHSSFFFDGLLLEDEATLVGLGVVEGDVIYVGDKGSFDDAFNSKTRVAKEISVGLNVLIGETELGFDVIHKDSESVLDTMSIPDCCKIAILKTQDSFFQAFEQVLAEPQFKSPKIIPDLSLISTALNEKSYASATEVIMDFNLAIGVYMRSLPSWPIEHLGIKMCRRLHDEFKHCSYSCTINHRLTLPADVVYIGPARNSNFSNYLAYPPTVQLRGRKINKDTTLKDLFFSYQMYSEKENLNINWLSHDNVDFDLDEKVFDVLGLDWNTSYRKKHFFYFPFYITKSEDTRRIDDLVEFIEGDGDIQPSESKKKRKKKRKSNQSQSVVATAETLDNVTGTSDDLEKDKDEDAKSEDLARNEIYGAISQNVQSELDAKHCKLNHLSKEKLYLERAIKEEHEHLVVHKQNVEDIIDSKSAEMKNLILMIEKSEDEKNDRLKEVNKIDIELSDLETKMAELKMKKAELLKAGSRDDELIQKFDSKKHKLEGYIEKELKKAKEKVNSIEANIQDLEKKLSTTVKAIENLPNEVLTFPTIPPVEPNRQLLDFIDNQISEKEKELECPVCLEVAVAPIFMCSDLHLICSNCRPKVKECPECRIQYEGKPKRHRYAEKTAGELVRLKCHRAQSDGSAL